MPLRCKIDENLPLEAAALLRSAGHECHTVFDESLGGSSDQTLSERCRGERRALFTLDLDFADIRAYPPDLFSGIVVLRLVDPDRDRILEGLRRTLSLLEAEALDGSLWVVEESRVRIRRIEPQP